MSNEFELNKEIDDYIDIRLKKFQNQFGEEPYVLIHVIPKKNFFDHFSLSVLDIQSIFQNGIPNSLGISVESKLYTYSLYRNGTFEMCIKRVSAVVNSNGKEKKKFFPIPFIEILNQSKIFIKLTDLYKKHQINPPYYVSFIFNNVKDYIFFYDSYLFQENKCSDHTIKVPKFEVNELPLENIIDSQLKPIMDIIANAFGYVQWDFKK